MCANTKSYKETENEHIQDNFSKILLQIFNVILIFLIEFFRIAIDFDNTHQPSKYCIITIIAILEREENQFKVMVRGSNVIQN